MLMLKKHCLFDLSWYLPFVITIGMDCGSVAEYKELFVTTGVAFVTEFTDIKLGENFKPKSGMGKA